MTIVAVLSMPMLCAVRMSASQSSVMIFFGLTRCRTRSTRISAPPPGRLSSPAACRRSSVSRTESPACRAKCWISVAVNEWITIDGNSRLIARSISS